MTFDEAEKVLEEDLKIINIYYTSWRLKPNPSKTVISVFHLNNKDACSRSPVVKFNNVELVHEKYPKYLGIYLDRTLSFKHHLEKTSLKIRTRNNLIHKLCGTK